MKEIRNQSEINEYLVGLFKRTLDGDLNAQDELSKIAFGGNVEARHLVMVLDDYLINNKPIPEGLITQEIYSKSLQTGGIIQTETKHKHLGGVLLEDWSTSDQKLLLKGELPKGIPIHRNI